MLCVLLGVDAANILKSICEVQLSVVRLISMRELWVER